MRVQGPAEAVSEVRDTFVPVTERPITVDAGPTSNIDMLRSNPLIQLMVEERMALLEAKMKLELQGGMSRRRKSGRYNISDTPHSTPHLRWPNESCVIGTARKRTTFGELTLGQFVIGLVTNALDTQHTPTMKSMLNELVETVKLAENISWPIARGAFAASMLKIEDESITWADSRTYSLIHLFSISRILGQQQCRLASHRQPLATDRLRKVHASGSMRARVLIQEITWIQRVRRYFDMFVSTVSRL